MLCPLSYEREKRMTIPESTAPVEFVRFIGRATGCNLSCEYE